MFCEGHPGFPRHLGFLSGYEVFASQVFWFRRLESVTQIERSDGFLRERGEEYSVLSGLSSQQPSLALCSCKRPLVCRGCPCDRAFNLLISLGKKRQQLYPFWLLIICNLLEGMNSFSIIHITSSKAHLQKALHPFHG